MSLGSSILLRLTLGAALANVVMSGGCSESPSATIADANQLFLEAKEQEAAGDIEQAAATLAQSIAANPSVFSYRERARLLEKLGRDDEALADCDAAIALSPEEPDAVVLWLKGELKKPKAERFLGQFKNPPASRR